MTNSDQPQPRFYQLLEQRFNDILKSENFFQKELTPALIRNIREAFLSQLNYLFSRSNHKLSQLAQVWLCDQYFKEIKINDTQVMSDLVVINEYTLDELTLTDVTLLNDLFSMTKLGPILKENVEKRKTELLS